MLNLHSSMDRLETDTENLVDDVIVRFTFQYG